MKRRAMAFDGSPELAATLEVGLPSRSTARRSSRRDATWLRRRRERS